MSESEIKYVRGQVNEIILTEDDIDILRMNGILQMDGIEIKKEKIHYKYYCNECGKVFPEDNKLDYRCDDCGGNLNSQEIIN